MKTHTLNIEKYHADSTKVRWEQHMHLRLPQAIEIRHTWRIAFLFCSRSHRVGITVRRTSVTRPLPNTYSSHRLSRCRPSPTSDASHIYAHNPVLSYSTGHTLCHKPQGKLQPAPTLTSRARHSKSHRVPRNPLQFVEMVSRRHGAHKLEFGTKKIE